MFLVRSRAAYWAFLICLCFATSCHAIGFGDLKVYSYLDEPLVAEIELTNYEGMDTNLLLVSLASEKDFARAGIDRPYFLTNLLFQTFTYNKKLMILIRTSRPVKSPYLEFLVEISWPEGNLIKDYTILLDPPPINLTAANRPKPLSQLAEEEAKQQVNVADAIQQQINMQKAAQQKQEAEESIKNVVRVSPNSFTDQSFDMPIEKPKPTQLVPTEVPEVLVEEEEKAKQVAAAKQVVAEHNEYQKQLEAFQQQQKQHQAKIAKEKATATPLGDLVNELDFIDSNSQTMDVDQIIAAQNKLDAAHKAAAANNVNPSAATPAANKQSEETVDFSHPLPPVTPLSGVPIPGSTPTVNSSDHNAAATPSPAFKIPTGVPMVGATPPSSSWSSNHLYLGIILSLLLLAAGIAIAIKRGVLSNIMAKHAAATAAKKAEAENATEGDAITFGSDSLSGEIPVSDANEQKTFDAAAEELNAEDSEEIELTAAPVATPTETAASNAEDLNKFEKDLERMDLNQLAPEIPKATGAMNAFNFTSATSVPLPKPRRDAPEPQPVASDVTTVETTALPTPAASKSSLKLASDDIDITPPTMDNSAVTKTIPNSSLKLETLGAKISDTAVSLAPATGTIIDNTEAVQIKLDLAKKYLETGDRESAKSLLQEVLEIANDSQKIEAQLLLSGII